MGKCKICNHPITPFIDFGKMPIANAFLKTKSFDDEYFYNLMAAYCKQCMVVQILEHPTPEQMFHDSYAFFSRTSCYMVEHFKQFSQIILDKYITDKDPFIVEIGSNDGILLEHYAKKNIKHIGIEPSQNVANVAKNYGINTISDFFSISLAKKIKNEYGQADALLSANVICHIPNLHEIGEAAYLLLKDNGVLVFEDPYFGDIFQKTSYDQIYDEHIYFFSAHAVKNIFSLHDLELIDTVPQTTHGGSMRYILAKKGQREVSLNVKRQLDFEINLGLNKSSTYKDFKIKCESSKDNLKTLLSKIKNSGKKIVGYAATAKSSTVLNYCNITSDCIDYIVDTTPIKQNTFTPGSHIPVYSHNKFIDDPPEYTLLFAWNHKDEILEKEYQYLKNGGKWIVYVPEVDIISK